MRYPHSYYLAYLDSHGDQVKDIAKKVADLGYPPFTKASLKELRSEFCEDGVPNYEEVFKLAGIEAESKKDWASIPHLLADKYMRIRVNVFAISQADPEVISNFCRARYIEISPSGMSLYLALFFNMKVSRTAFNAFIDGLEDRREAETYSEAIHEDPQSVLFELGVIPNYDLERSLSDMAYAAYHKFMKVAVIPGTENSNHALRWAKAMTDVSARMEKARLNKTVDIRKSDTAIQYDDSELPTLDKYHSDMYEILKKRGDMPPSGED